MQLKTAVLRDTTLPRWVFQKASKKNVACGVKGGLLSGTVNSVEGNALETLRTSNTAKQPHMPDERNLQINPFVKLKIRIN
jgi:hypothetical protein